MDQWEALREECLACRRCALADTRHNVVFGEGAMDAEIMCIGEGPGENEDLTGRPFVGRGVPAAPEPGSPECGAGGLRSVAGQADPADSAQDHHLPGTDRRHEVYQGGLQDHPGAWAVV